MAPEVLDTRVHLQDLQSFKQIDIYAFSLIMWEIMSRCAIFNGELRGEGETTQEGGKGRGIRPDEKGQGGREREGGRGSL